MHLLILGRRRTRRALLAAALPAVLAAVALPSAAHADTVAVVKSDNRLGYFQTPHPLNLIAPDRPPIYATATAIGGSGRRLQGAC